MAGIGTIGTNTPYFSSVSPYSQATTSGRTPSGVLGTSAGLGETKSVGPGAGRPDEASKESDTGLSPSNLTDEEQRAVDELKRRDQEVRRHEQAHVSAAGRYANGGPQFEFTRGPDGRQYATGGHVNIDVGPANTPEATLIKAQVIRRAALAPSEPSGADRAVASAATELERSARQQIQKARKEEGTAGGNETGTGLQAPSPLARKDFSGYAPQNERGGGDSVRQLDVRA